MTKVNIVNNTSEKSGTTHSSGYFYFSEYGAIYILAVVDYSKVCLISTDGTRWNDSYEVKNVNSITAKEFQGISSGVTFTKIDSITITIE